MSISGMRNSSYSYNVNNSNHQNIYKKLASGKKINSAKDDAAGLAIAKKLLTQETSYNVTNNNLADSQNMLNTADGGLSNVTNSLQRIRELATQASNGTYSDSDKAAMQQEIDQLKQQIDSTSKGSNFNGLPLSDGSGSTDMSSKFDATTKGLGIENFDITKGFHIDDIDKALDQVSGMRGNIGATSNTMNHTINANAIASINLTAARSRIEDADIAKVSMDLKRNQILRQTNIYTQLMQQQNMKSGAGKFINILA